jgi:hypothetical protein
MRAKRPTTGCWGAQEAVDGAGQDLRGGFRPLRDPPMPTTSSTLVSLIREFLASSSARPSTLDRFSVPMIVEPQPCTDGPIPMPPVAIARLTVSIY